MQPDPELARAISASLTRICAHSAFFATLALFARVEQSLQVPTAATDGNDIFVNPNFFMPLTPAERDGLLLHEVLHAALLHVPRRAGRDQQLWNVAADIVINGMILKQGLTLPQGGLRDERREHLSVEEVYELLLREAEPQQGGIGEDLLEEAPGDAGDAQQEAEQKQAGQQAAQKPGRPSPKAGDPGSEGERHWRQAMDQARVVARSSLAGKEPGGIERELGSVGAARLDWRSYLWRFLTRTPTDFGDFDRRFVGDELYLESLAGESVNVLLAIDTSGSLDSADMQAFIGELQGILHAYPHLQCELYYADAALYGPYRLKARDPIPSPVGGGGTDFRPFFEATARHAFTHGTTVAIYLTDGYGPFPSTAPRYPVLWVVTAGGRNLDGFPFGETVRLLASAHTPFVAH